MDDLLQNESKRINKLLHVVVHDPCWKNQHSLLDSDYRGHSKYKYRIEGKNDSTFFTNGSLYLPYYYFVESKFYCLAIMYQNKFEIIICSETVNHQKENKKITKKQKFMMIKVTISSYLEVCS